MNALPMGVGACVAVDRMKRGQIGASQHDSHCSVREGTTRQKSHWKGTACHIYERAVERAKSTQAGESRVETAPVEGGLVDARRLHAYQRGLEQDFWAPEPLVADGDNLQQGHHDWSIACCRVDNNYAPVYV